VIRGCCGDSRVDISRLSIRTFYGADRLSRYGLLSCNAKAVHHTMPPLAALSGSDLELLNDTTRSVKRATLVSLCRKASLKAKGTV
jgi:hypothetical protein